MISDPPPCSDATLVRDVAKAYTTKLALDLLQMTDGPFARVIEHVEVDHGECRRKLVIDWHLPTLEEALPHLVDEEVAAKFADASPVLVVPIFIIRRGRLLNSLTVEDSMGERLFMCGRDEGVDRVRLVLSSLWSFVELVPRPQSGCDEDLVDEAKKAFFGVASAKPASARTELIRTFELLKKSGLVLGAPLTDRLEMLGRLLVKRHVMWLHLARRPGQATRLTLSYRTRFAADYRPKPKVPKPQRAEWWGRAVDCLRRFSGQEPFRLRVPVGAHSLCRSYHFTMAAPHATYFAEQRFVFESKLSGTTTEQRHHFNAHCTTVGATVSGANEAGGPVAHLYATDLTSIIGDQLYAYGRVQERPPGTTALVMWLSLLAGGFMWLYYLLWPWMVQNDTRGIDVAAFFIALPGLASIWFSRVFREDVRARVPLISRLGLILVGVAAFYSLLAIMIQRGTCSVSVEPGATGLGACPGSLMAVFSQEGLLITAVLLTIMSVWLIERRFRFHQTYQRLQTGVIDQYMR